MNNFTICVVGASNTGKTTWLNRHVNGEFINSPLDNPVVSFTTNYGQFNFTMVDGTFTESANLCIVFHQYDQVDSRQFNVPTINVVSKRDIYSSSILPKHMPKCVFLSSKTAAYFETPMLEALRILSGHSDIVLVE